MVQMDASARATKWSVKALGDDDSDCDSWKRTKRIEAEVSSAVSQMVQTFPGLVVIESERQAEHSVRRVIRAIRKGRKTVGSDFTPSAVQVDALLNFSIALEHRSEDAGGHANVDFLEDAIFAAELAVQATPKERPELPQLLDSLSDMLAGRSKWASSTDLDAAIEVAERAAELTPTGEPQKILRRQNVSGLYEERFERSGGNCKADLEQAISNIQKIIEDSPQIDQQVLSQAVTTIACLRFKGGEEEAVSTVLEVPFESLSEMPISLEGLKSCCFRFLDCRAFVRQSVVRILDFGTLPMGRYTAISYVWGGFKDDKALSSLQLQMVVKGAEDADPISLAVLHTVCLASLSVQCEMLWLDRLCIIQNNNSDKSWQIQRMYQIYQSCKVCLVLPGGLMRLGSLSEETSWIQRAWTLQEAIAPPRVECIISWPWGNATLRSHFGMAITEIEAGTSGMVDLLGLLRGSLGKMRILPRADADPLTESLGIQPINIFAKPSGSHSSVEALLGILTSRNKAQRANAIWRSALMRTSSRPVDMVFSIMGLLGVTLEPLSFAKNDRVRATIELARTLLAKGEAAHWLAISLELAPDPHMSTLPVMPETSVDGKAYVKTPNGLEEVVSLIDSAWWWLSGAPKGTMDEQGYFKFSAKAAPVTSNTSRSSNNRMISSMEGQKWALVADSKVPNSSESATGSPSSFAVVIGKKERYADATYGSAYDNLNTIVMFVEQHVLGKWHNVGYGLVEEDLVLVWHVREFEVGGPKVDFIFN